MPELKIVWKDWETGNTGLHSEIKIYIWLTFRWKTSMWFYRKNTLRVITSVTYAIIAGSGKRNMFTLWC